ncbi:phosphatase PAP2 family protein [Pseudonocardia broussonetiae]|uniref:Phosphatase PAP2 family protein n=1 Tax=Pseudonocardia broussonetiae TaxID=2736640 RepID=A0A6M6JG94_9PSEU|nr:phosphatase PAP2 family protein [Pseudonocardia broussonetiae]QJY47038.1 phosphatase PAP2 family protein [Pseudonocardia broussonetiae]
MRPARTGRSAADATAALCALVLLGLGLAVLGGTAPWAVDRAAAAATAGLTASSYDLLLAVDLVGEPVVAVGLAVLIALACLLCGRARLAAVAPLALALTAVAVASLKPLIGRTIHGPENLAYPSGHTATAAVLALVLLLLLVDLVRPGRLAAAALVVTGTVVAAGVMAVAQVALSAHYATDTLGGLCLAVVTVTVTVRLVAAVPARTAVPAAPRGDPP